MPEFKPFTSARLKVERAKQHINEFNTLLNSFLKTDFYRLRIQRDANGVHYVRFDLVNCAPAELAVMGGDAIHNARTALDHIAAQMFLEKTGRSSSHIKFPFYGTRQALVAACNGGHIQQAGANAIALICDRICPYNGGNDVLVTLHDLDIIDKHLLLIPHITVGEIRHTIFDLGNDNIYDWSIKFERNDGLFVVPVRSRHPIQIKQQGQASFSVLFGDGLPVKGKPILPTLLQFVELSRAQSMRSRRSNVNRPVIQTDPLPPFWSVFY